MDAESFEYLKERSALDDLRIRNAEDDDLAEDEEILSAVVSSSQQDESASPSSRGVGRSGAFGVNGSGEFNGHRGSHSERSPFSQASPGGSVSEYDRGKSVDVADYPSSIQSMSLRDIQREPTRLRSERDRLREELSGLTFDNYRGFLHSVDVVRSVAKDIRRMDQVVRSLNQSSLSSLAEACNELVHVSESLQSKRTRERNLLLHAATLQNVLDVPVLMDTCMRAGLYDEVVALADFASNRTDGIMSHVNAEVGKTKALIVDHFWEQLEGPVSLPQCLKAVHYIRRLASVELRELQLKFLFHRGRWATAHCQAILQGAGSSGSTTSSKSSFGTGSVAAQEAHLSQFVFDAYRDTTAEVINQYRYLFGADASREGGSTPKSGPATGSSLASDADRQFVDPLMGWVHSRSQELLKIVDSRLTTISDGDELRALADEVMSSRSPIVARCLPLIEERVFRSYQERLVQANALLSSGSMVYQPDQKGLLQWPLLAVVYNAYLKALNELRVCAFRSLRKRVWDVTEKMLAEIHDDQGVADLVRGHLEKLWDWSDQPPRGVAITHASDAVPVTAQVTAGGTD